MRCLIDQSKICSILISGINFANIEDSNCDSFIADDRLLKSHGHLAVFQHHPVVDGETKIIVGI
jgi:hypothetical protein